MERLPLFLIAILQAVVCGFLCAMCHPNIDSLQDLIKGEQIPEALKDYINEPLNLPAKELAKREGYSVLIEVNKVYGNILALYDKIGYYMQALESQRYMPIGYIMSTLFICLCAIGFRLGLTAILIIITCNVVSHILFFYWNAKRHAKNFTAYDLNWECKLYPESVYFCVSQANIAIQHRYNFISGVYSECKAGKQWYLALTALFALVLVFNM